MLEPPNLTRNLRLKTPHINECIFLLQGLSRLYLEDNRRATLQAGFSVASDHHMSLVTWTQGRDVTLKRSVQATTAMLSPPLLLGL